MIKFKPGFTTSEFFITSVTLVAGVLDMIVLPAWANAVLPVVYTLSRTIAKR